LTEEEIDSDQSRLKAAKITMLVSLLVVFVGGTFAVMQVLKPAQSLADKVVREHLVSEGKFQPEPQETYPMDTAEGAMIRAPEELRQMGATPQEVEDVRSFDFGAASNNQLRFGQLLNKYLAVPNSQSHLFKTTVPSAGFAFPTDIVLGFISFDAAKPVGATGVVPAPAKQRACFYLSWAARHFPYVLNKFGPADLTGLQVACSSSLSVIDIVKKWSNLKELCFFNVLLKAMPGFEMTDESDIKDSDLPALEQLTGLRSLGLCGTEVTGPAILAMPMLKKLETIKLKRVKNIGPLIEDLPALDNIKEVWLIGEDTTDAQIEVLTNMKNLTTLKIMRSKLTPASFKYFREMSNLKHLTLDKNNWTESEKSKFARGTNGWTCRFEPLMDTTYWPLFPGVNGSLD
jgi:hypothetical protein